GIASDGRLWRVLAREGDALVPIKETILNPDKPGEFLSWLDGGCEGNRAFCARRPPTRGPSPSWPRTRCVRSARLCGSSPRCAAQSERPRGEHRTLQPGAVGNPPLPRTRCSA